MLRRIVWTARMLSLLKWRVSWQQRVLRSLNAMLIGSLQLITLFQLKTLEIDLIKSMNLTGSCGLNILGMSRWMRKQNSSGDCVPPPQEAFAFRRSYHVLQ
ncbi:hypothetical protein BT96DRAFT_392562 [Gymnopus androsaceus JB14]|uniref:Uncharacterized protein n=1 Tax=Gymnopus androsaceus JB14 TaxID=1447944 RepID=A0A6A4GUV7_9AGAR|nr:hypothetical protein BT96DRAFT_392562 [Gymnopus androsaceus JB14]